MNEEIIDKLRGFEITQKKLYIRTKPSAIYPRGKFYIGYLRFIDSKAIKFSFLEDKEGLVEIYYSDILSPSDIKEAY
jgi:hypothetical protein